MAKNQTRRNFLRVAPLAAAAVSTVLPTRTMLASTAAFGQDQAPALQPSQVLSADKIADAMRMFQTQLGEHYLYQPKASPLTIAMTTQEKKQGREFEYHEHRDHVFVIMDGATTFEVGGTPREARNTRPGEWLAPASEGATTMEVKKGDMLVIPRGTPHRQSTEKSVTWVLISDMG